MAILVLQTLCVYGLATSSTQNATLYHVSITNKTVTASQPSSTSPDESSSRSQPMVSQSTSSTAVHGMGDFRALGLGMSATDELSLTDTYTIARSSNSSTPSIALASHSHSQSNQSHTSIELQQSASNSTVLPMSSSSMRAPSHTGHTNSSILWPSTALVRRYDAIAGCTVGCGDCAMQGETVELIYWPPATSLANVTHVGPWTVETLGTTLTSPTVRASRNILWKHESNVLSRFTSPSTPFGRRTAAARLAVRSRTPSSPSQRQRICHRYTV